MATSPQMESGTERHHLNLHSGDSPEDGAGAPLESMVGLLWKSSVVLAVLVAKAVVWVLESGLVELGNLYHLSTTCSSL